MLWSRVVLAELHDSSYNVNESSSQHYVRNHGALRRPLLLQSTTILDKDDDRHRLRVQLREILHIMCLKPTLNITQETFFLPTNIRRNWPINNEEIAAEGIAIRPPESPAAIEAPENPATRNSPVPFRRSARIQ